MGQLKVVNGGIQLDGQALILDELRTSNIRSRHGQPITFGDFCKLLLFELFIDVYTYF
jgi:hypothetical protein